MKRLRPSIGCLVLISLASSGCATRATKNAAMLGGGVLAAAGVALMVPAARADHSDEPFGELADAAELLPGVLFIATGAVIALIGAASNPPPPPREFDDAAVAAVTVTPLPTRGLPEIASDAATLQLAKQARRAAMHLECTTVEFVLTQLIEHDPAYHHALVAGGTVAPCR